jgi:16S rRNA (cytosine1402-N4)-methyltransferase
MYHEPVMLEEVLDNLVASPAGLYLDGTLGGGGHAAGILGRLGPQGRLVALDWDADAHSLGGGAKLAGDPRLQVFRLNFAELESLPPELLQPGFEGILMDLGLSSRHLVAERGFAYGEAGPLDMRMDARVAGSAADLLAEADEARLAGWLREFGEVRAWRRLAGAIVRARAAEPMLRTEQLVAVVEAEVGTRGSYKILSQVFQALRIAVNNELDNLDRGLDAALRRLRPGGTLAVITYHSLEDRMVKRRFRRWAGEAVSVRSRHLPAAPEAQALVELPHRGGLVPGGDEQRRNPRSRSARLRLARKRGA